MAGADGGSAKHAIELAGMIEPDVPGETFVPGLQNTFEAGPRRWQVQQTPTSRFEPADRAFKLTDACGLWRGAR